MGLGKPPGTLLFSVNVLYISEQNFLTFLFFEQKCMNKTQFIIGALYLNKIYFFKKRIRLVAHWVAHRVWIFLVGSTVTT